MSQHDELFDDPLIQGGQGRSAEDIWFSAWCVVACCAGILAGVLIFGAAGCSARTESEAGEKLREMAR